MRKIGDLSGFANGANVYVVGRPKVSAARVLLGIAALAAAGTLAIGHAPAMAPMKPATLVSANLHAKGVSPIHVEIRTRTASTKLHAAYKPLLVADHDSTGDDARALLGMLGGGQQRSDRPASIVAEPDRSVEPGFSEPTASQSDLDAERENDSDPTAHAAGQARAPSTVVDEGAPTDFHGVAAPKGTEGITYSLATHMHEHVTTRGDVEIIEGGFTHRDFGGSNGNGKNNEGKPIDVRIVDPSEAFMNLAVQTYMQNTQADFDQAVEIVERMHKTARSCVEDFGPDHTCTFGASGISFNYSMKRFTARLDPHLSNGKRQADNPGKLVAVESVDGLIKGPAFERVAQAEHEAVQVPRI